MVAMKRSQLKALIKECLIEILQENVELEVSLKPSIMQEVASGRPRRPQALPELINPMDDDHLSMRQSQLYQQQALRAQNMRQRRQLPSSFDDGLSSGGFGDDDSSSRYNREDTGTRSPSDYLRLAGNYQTRFDPRLDMPVGGAPVPATTRGAHRQLVERHAPQQDHGRDGVSLEASADVMRAIYDDTMRTTYREQASNGHTSPGHHNAGLGSGAAPADAYAAHVERHAPEELFEGAGNWAALAFPR